MNDREKKQTEGILSLNLWSVGEGETWTWTKKKEVTRILNLVIGLFHYPFSLLIAIVSSHSPLLTSSYVCCYLPLFHFRAIFASYALTSFHLVSLICEQSPTLFWCKILFALKSSFVFTFPFLSFDTFILASFLEVEETSLLLCKQAISLDSSSSV